MLKRLKLRLRFITLQNNQTHLSRKTLNSKQPWILFLKVLNTNENKVKKNFNVLLCSLSHVQRASQKKTCIAKVCKKLSYLGWSLNLIFILKSIFFYSLQLKSKNLLYEKNVNYGSRLMPIEIIKEQMFICKILKILHTHINEGLQLKKNLRLSFERHNPVKSSGRFPYQ